jgi:MSHA pilin protein MshD
MNDRGFTFIEIIMVIVVLGIIMPGVMLYFIQGVSGSAAAQRRTTAILLAEGLMEEIKSKRWDETAAGINSTCTDASVMMGADGETRADYDDIDDFNGISNTPPQDSQGAVMANYPGFSQQVAVSYASAADLDSAAGGPTCYKRIAVTITDTSGGGAITLVTLKTAYSSH